MPFFEKVRELIQNRDCFGGRLAEMRIDYEKKIRDFLYHMYYFACSVVYMECRRGKRRVVFGRFLENNVWQPKGDYELSDYLENTLT